MVGSEDIQTNQLTYQELIVNSSVARLEDAFFITPPDHILLPNNCPKILLLGSGDRWKKDLISFFLKYWSNQNFGIFYYPGNTSDDNLSWIVQTHFNSDYTIFHINEDYVANDLILLGKLLNNKSVYLSIEEKNKLETICLLCSQFHKHIIERDPKNFLKKIKKNWNVRYLKG